MAKRITGYVRQVPSGAALAGKTVHLIDLATGLDLATGGHINLATNPVTSDANGKFIFIFDLSPGPVRVKADISASEFKYRDGSETMQSGAVYLDDLPRAFRVIKDGIIKTLGAEFLCTVAGHTITITDGYGIFRGILFGFDSGSPAKQLTAADNPSLAVRHDFLVLRQYHAGSLIGKQELKLILGTVSATDPVVTSSEADLTQFIQGPNIWDTPIYRALTNQGSANTTLADLRGSATSPYATVHIANDAVGADQIAELSITDAHISATAAIAATKIGGGLVSNTEFSHLDGVTANLQTQIDGKSATGHTHAHSALTGIDTDASPAAIHHTLGSGANQAAAGDHAHGGFITVSENGVPLDTDITTLDFDTSDFNLTESPENEVNIGLNYGTGANQPAEGSHGHALTHGSSARGNAARDEVASGLASVTSTTGQVVTGLFVDITLANGKVYDVIINGGASIQAPTSGNIYIAAVYDSLGTPQVSPFNGEGTEVATKPHSAGFVFGGTGDGGSFRCGLWFKVSGGTGFVGSGAVTVIALPREAS